MPSRQALAFKAVLLFCLNLAANDVLTTDTNETLTALTGLSPALSKIYLQEEKLALGALATLLVYQNDNSEAAQSSVLKFSPVLGYRYQPQLIFNSRFTFENGGAEAHNGGSDQVGGTTVDFAYIDYLYSPQFKIRFGHQLIPVGLSNTNLDPGGHYSVSAPEVESEILPGTWHESGLQIWGVRERFLYQVGIYNSMDVTRLQGSGDVFLKDARQNGSGTKAESLMGLIRVDYIHDNLLLGLSFARGEINQDSDLDKTMTMSLLDLHLKAKIGSFDVHAVYARSDIENANAISAILPAASGGYYLNLAFEPVKLDSPDWTLPVFLRHSEYNLHETMSDAQTANPKYHRTRTTAGLNLRYRQELSFMANYQWRKNKSEDEPDLFELGVALFF